MIVQSQSITLSDLSPAPGINPNEMSEDEVTSLTSTIKSGGFLQPILAMRDPEPDSAGRFWIIDGVHRCEAAKRAGLTAVSAVLVSGWSLETVRAYRIGMNKLRGRLNIGSVARELEEIVDANAVAISDVAMMTGFSETDITDLLNSLHSNPDAALEGANVGVGEPADEEDTSPVKPFVLELTFASREELSRAKRALRKAAGGGKNADMSRGLLNLVEGA